MQPQVRHVSISKIDITTVTSITVLSTRSAPVPPDKQHIRTTNKYQVQPLSIVWSVQERIPGVA